VAKASLDRFGAGDPHRVTKAFLSEHRDLFGHGAEAIESARLVRDFAGGPSGLQTAVWEQQFEGVPVFGGLLVSHTTRRGELVNVSSGFVPTGQADSAAPPPPGWRGHQPAFSLQQAVVAAAANIGETVSPAAVAVVVSSEDNQGSWLQVRAPQLGERTEARLVWLPMGNDRLRLCWEVVLRSAPRAESYRLLVAADLGEALVRQRLTYYSAAASYRVFISDSPSPFTPGHRAPCTRQPPVTERRLVTLTALSTNASPRGWIDEGVNETRGNNASVHQFSGNSDQPCGPCAKGAPFRVFDFPLDLTQAPSNYWRVSAAQAFYWCNWAHDRLYELGFTEAAGNFQVNNLGRGGVGGDPMKVVVQSPSRFSNASIDVDRDGCAATMQLYVWTDPYPDRDCSLDAEVILHEYVHGLSSRLAGGGAGLSQLQAQGLGEGWSDFYSLALLSESTDDLDGVYPLGGYTAYLLGHAENYYFGIRRYPYSADLRKSPLTFRDIDPTQISPHQGVPMNPRTTFRPERAGKVHNQGEVWCGMLWEVRANLIRKHGYALGNQLTLWLVTDGIRLCPPNPTFIQARDALLQAESVHTGGANLREVWAGFAKRGLGYSATGPEGNQTVGVREAFDLPDDLYSGPAIRRRARGPVGGPFTPADWTLSLTNLGVCALAWSAGVAEPWLRVVPAQGELAPEASTTLRIAIGAVASFLPAGAYTNFLSLTNQGAGRRQVFPLELEVGARDYFTEYFRYHPNDLSYQCITLTPDGSPDFYAACREPATNFPTSPIGGKSISVEGSVLVTLQHGATVAVYDVRTNVLGINPSGPITFGQTDVGGSRPESHFELPRITPMLVMCPASGNVSWKQLDDRLAVTYINVVPYEGTTKSSFQAELFFDGRIRFTYLSIGERGGLAGVSKGGGLPADFTGSDFTLYPLCQRQLALQAPRRVVEGAGALEATVSRLHPDEADLEVRLASSNEREVQVPPIVTIPVGRTNVAFPLTVLQDQRADGCQALTLTAAAAGYGTAVQVLFVADRDRGMLALELPERATEGETVFGKVSIGEPVFEDLVVSLSSLEPGSLQVQPLVIVPAGQSSAEFSVLVLDNSRLDSARTAKVQAAVEHWPSAEAAMTVEDDENLALQLRMPAQVSEAAGVISNRCEVRISGSCEAALTVLLQSSDPELISVPPGVVIPRGQTNVGFLLAVANDGESNEARIVTITAAAAGWQAATASVSVWDDETPIVPQAPSPANGATSQPLKVRLSWSPGTGNLLVNGDFEAGTFDGWEQAREALSPDGLNPSHARFVLNDGTYDVASAWGGDPRLWPFCSGTHSALGSSQHTSSLAPGWARLSQDVAIPRNISQATLRWADQPVSEYPFSTNYYFQAEVRSTNDAVLEVLYHTRPGDPITNAWQRRSCSLTHYAGETIRLAFQIEQLSALGLDEVALEIRAAEPEAYEVYCGTHPLLGPADWQGTATTNECWLADLAPNATYYWSVVACKGLSRVSSPVWQFRTQPDVVSGFRWAGIATPQQAGQPFAAALTALDAKGKPTECAGPVAVRGYQVTERQPMFTVDFEDGSYAGWVTDSRASGAPYTRIVTQETVAGGRYSLSLLGGTNRHDNGLLRKFKFGLKPDHISFCFRTSATNRRAGFLCLTGSDGSGFRGVTFAVNAAGRMGLYGTDQSFQGIPHLPNQWYRVELWFDWARRRVTCLVDGRVIAANVPFQDEDFASVRAIHLYNWDRAQVWWDEIVFWEGDKELPVLSSPNVLANFARGVWSGPMTVSEPAARMVLLADDGRGHRGVSTPFEVVADSDGDGLPDQWEVAHGLNPGDPADAWSDVDGDGLANVQEFQAGTDPGNPFSAVRITEALLDDAGMHITFWSVQGRHYALEWTPSLLPIAWNVVESQLPGVGARTQVLDRAALNRASGFYRVKLVP
jgi:hypothetical protein